MTITRPRLFLIACFWFSSLIHVTAEQVIFSEIHYHPEDGKPEFIEIRNNTATPLDIVDWTLSGGVDYVFPGFDASNGQNAFIHNRQRILLVGVSEAEFRAAYPATPEGVRILGPWTGNLSDRGETLTLKDKNGAVMTTVSYEDRGHWSSMADGLGHSLVVKRPNQYVNDWRNWTYSLSKGGTPGADPESPEGGIAIDSPEIDLSAALPVVELGSEWKYFDETQDLGTAWSQPDYDDSGWKTGVGMFGYETRTLPAPGIQTDLTRDSAGGLTTYYFRKEIQFTKNPVGSRITIGNVLDDGAVYYMNGQELGRVRIADGAVNWQTEATKVPEEGVLEEGVLSVDGSAFLVPGRNVFAVEVHNESAASSDLVFGATVSISASSAGAVINEVAPGAGGFVEFFNPADSNENLKGHYLTDDVANLTKYHINADLVAAPRAHVSVDLDATGLPAALAELYLVAPDGTTVISAVTVPAGAGSSVSRKPSGSSTWFVFSEPQRDVANVGAGDLRNQLSISEVHFSADGSKVDWVELHASTAGNVSVDGLFLSGVNDFSDKVAVNGTIPANGYMAFDVEMPLDGNDVTVSLRTSGGNVIIGERFERDSGVVALQEYPAGSGEYYESTTDTKAAANNPPRNTSIVINEIMADPPSNSRNGEFVELYNRGTSPVDLSGWRFVDGISYDIPAGTSLAAGQYLVIAANAPFLKSAYSGITIIGDYSGNLANEGELLRLEDAGGNLVDQVDYKSGGDWPIWANGGGSSMELLNPAMDNDHSTAWRDSDESQKSTFESFSASGTYAQLETMGSASTYKELHLHLVGESHIILKNIKLTRNGEPANILENAGVDTPNGQSSSGWLSQGTHWASHFEANEYHLIADGHGDNRANKAEIDATDLSRDDAVELTFEARWVAGKPTLIAQTYDHSFAPVFHLNVPNNLGTPGAQNSRYVANTPATVSEVAHSPAVPKEGDLVTITARVTSATALQSIDVVYREDSRDNSNPWQTAAMNDDGVSGDAVGGDGIYSGRITNQSVDGRIVQFYVRAIAAGGAENRAPVREAWPAMFVVDNQEIDPEGLTTYRWVISEYDERAWATGSGRGGADYDYKFPFLSNSYKNMTMIVDETEIFYGAEIRPSGSPWHTSARANLRQRGKWKMPSSSMFRNSRKFTFDNTLAAEGAGALHNNNMMRYLLYQLGYEVNEDEFALTIENDGTPEFNEIVEPCGNDMLDRFWADGSDGEFYKIDDHFRFDDNYGKAEITNRYFWYDAPNSRGETNYPDPNAAGSYHTAWIKRSREADYDYSALINFFKTLSENEYTEEEIGRMVNIDKLAIMTAVRGYAADWDSVTNTRPKNSFFYRPPNGGRWQILHWDSDLGFQSGSAGDPIYTGGRELGAFLKKDYVERKLRYFLSYLWDNLVDVNNSPRTQAFFEAEENASPHREYTARGSIYATWFNARDARMLREIDDHLEDPLVVNPVTAVEGDVISVTGSAGYRAYTVVLDGHPEAEIKWIDDTNWQMDNIVLKQGENALAFRAVDQFGNAAFGGDSQTAAISVTKAENSAPYATLEVDPGSQNLHFAETFSLDASGSSDPEGAALTYSWTGPAVNATLNSSGSTASAQFQRPGLYEFAVDVSDGSKSTSQMREASVYGPDGFSSFGSDVLEDYWTVVNTSPLDNFARESSYDINGESAGKLKLIISGDRAKPLAPLPPPLPDPSTYVDLGSVWSFDDSNTDLGTAFAAPDYDDSAWKSGPGLFGFESRTLPEPGLQTDLTRDSANGLTTYFLRTEFDFTLDPIGSEISIDAILDDGARFFLNGQELGRVRLPEGDIDASTVATKVEDEGVVEEDLLTLDGSLALKSGTNVLAVDLHNDSSGSSDVVFGMRLNIAAREVSQGGGGLPAPQHPLIWRDLPGGDFALATDFEITNRQFDQFMTGLMISTTEENADYRYAYGSRDGRTLSVVRINPNGSVVSLNALDYSGTDSLTVRIVRSGDNLDFEWREDGLWNTQLSLRLPANSKVSKGGIFASTDAAIGFIVDFDYVMLIDPSLGQRSALAEVLQVSELMYNPIGGDTYEFMELQNVGAQALDLTGIRFLDGEPFGELTLGQSTLAPGAYGLLVSNAAAFRERYGSGLDSKILGEWSGGNLRNSGEIITLVDAAGATIHSFEYGDSAPWPSAADGDGPSLVLINPQSAPDHANAGSWRASSATNGSPGAEDSGPDPGFLAFALGADILGVHPGSLTSVATTSAAGTDYLAFTYVRRTDAPGVTFTVETSTDLQNWTSDGPLTDFATSDNGNGTSTISVGSPLTPGNGAVKYMRLRVSQE
ncbi:MAG: lamin tail domain-containing protein [Verrucomicrobiales bacterium]